jgi:hypothetical protein
VKGMFFSVQKGLPLMKNGGVIILTGSWVTILEIQRDDWGIGGHTDWLRDYESALNTLGTDLKAR